VEPQEIKARVALAQDDIAQVRQYTRGVEVMPSAWGASPIAAQLRREVPGASQQLPTAALGTAGGGPFAVDPRDNQGVTALTRIFQVELALPADSQPAYLGARVYVRFDHGYEPVGFQVYRALRRLLLGHFDV
jgi:putative peptide zinc metalloprotease protein